MSRVFVHGLGAVSPAGWGVPALRAATANGEALPTKPLARPGWDKRLWIRQVPPPAPKPAFFAHPRLRRANLIARYTVGAAAEAIGTDVTGVQSGSVRLGIVVCVMAGCVTYSRRFCEETINDPAIASPLLFPETVFNAPASHLAAYLGATGASYTLVGDEGTFVQGLAPPPIGSSEIKLMPALSSALRRWIGSWPTPCGIFNTAQSTATARARFISKRMSQQTASLNSLA